MVVQLSDSDIIRLEKADSKEGATQTDLGDKKKVQLLIEMGVIESFRHPRKPRWPRYRTTEKGRELCRKMRSPRSLVFQILEKFEKIESEFGTLREDISSLKDILGDHPEVKVDKELKKDLESLIFQEYSKLNHKWPALGGVIEIPLLRKDVMSQLSISRNEFDAIILELKRKGIIELKFAGTSDKDPEEGIPLRGGVAYYVLWRKRS